MNQVRKVHRCCPAGKLQHTALRREHIDVFVFKILRVLLLGHLCHIGTPGENLTQPGDTVFFS